MIVNTVHFFINNIMIIVKVCLLLITPSFCFGRLSNLS